MDAKGNVVSHLIPPRRPVGMSGVRLEANVHLVTGAASAVQNLAKCIERCGIQVDALIPAAIAGARAVLTDDERELGVCLVDIAAGIKAST